MSYQDLFFGISSVQISHLASKARVLISQIAVRNIRPRRIFLLYTRDMQKKLFLYSAFLIVGIFILNKAAHFFYWYASISQFDMFMHALGGFFVALWGGALLYPLLKGNHWKLWVIVLCAFVLVVGFLWEVFEFSVQGVVRVETIANIPDSLSDMVFDMIGGILGTLFVLWRTARYNREQHAE